MFIENEITELKREYTKELSKEIIAFLNTRGGKIYIGVNDDGTICGLKDVDASMGQVTSMIHDSIRPDAKVFIRIHILENDLIEIDVKEGTNKPYYIQGKGLRPEGVYVRLGSASVPSSENMIKEMLMTSNFVGYEESLSPNQELTFEEMERVFRSNGLTINKENMKTLRLINKEGFYTNLGKLLSDQCLHTIKVAVFSGKDEFNFVDRKEFTGSVFKMLRDTLDYINLSNHLKSRIEGYERVENRDYNLEIIREGLLNALIHRDYSYSGSILVKIYEDRMDITSLGGLIYGLNYEDIQAGVSQSRNKYLASVFYRIKYVEAYGTGIRKILGDYRDYNPDELIHITDNVFKLVLWNKNYNVKNVLKEEKSIYSVISPEEKTILEFVDKQEQISRKELQEILGVGQTKAGLILSDLVKREVLQSVGKGKNRRYIIKK